MSRRIIQRMWTRACSFSVLPKLMTTSPRRGAAVPLRGAQRLRFCLVPVRCRGTDSRIRPTKDRFGNPSYDEAIQDGSSGAVRDFPPIRRRILAMRSGWLKTKKRGESVPLVPAFVAAQLELSVGVNARWREHTDLQTN